jgi:type IV pilus assembly protein PilY1
MYRKEANMIQANKLSKKNLSSLILALLYILLAAPVFADDSEIYFTSQGSEGNPNILFVLDSSGSMARDIDGNKLINDGDNPASRYQIMRRSLDTVLGAIPNNFNVGLLNYSGHDFEPQDEAKANGIQYPITVLDDTARTEMVTEIGSWRSVGWTPLVQSLYEASRYFKGLSVDYGVSSTSERLAHPDSYTGVISAVGTTGTGGTEYSMESTAVYKSPISAECQDNYIILLTDGEPNDGIPDGSDPDIINKITSNYGLSCASQPTDVEDGGCGPELTTFLATQDQSDLTGDQWIKTYAVGFAVENAAQSFLKDVSNLGDTDNAAGEAGFFAAGSEEQLTRSLLSALESITSGSYGFTQPVISIDTTTGLTHGDDALVPMFRPSSLPRWVGNLKKYRLDIGQHGPRLLDSAGNPVKGSDGKFVESTRSYWLPTGDDADGGKVNAGGAARLLGMSRNLKIDNDAGTSLVNLTDTSATSALMGTNDSGLKEKLVRFVKGLDPETGTSSSQRMGDIMHSTPVLFNYGNTHGSVVFVGTNEGYLHAFDASTGEEQFAFMPRELLININTLYENKFDSSHTHLYGMDGPLTLWHKDDNGNRVVDGSEKVYLYAGMRRGGKKYYALDITDPSSPSLVWEIEGGAGDFSKLAQTWSKPVLAKVDLDGDKDTVSKDVLIFGGGYDVDQDTATQRQTDDEGGAIYIVDAVTGAKLWSADRYSTGSSASSVMPNSIPADLRVIDIDGNGVHDRIYAADMGGRIYRVDLPDSENKAIPSGEKITAPRVTKLADLSTDGSIEHNRRFYSEPDTAMIVDGRERYMAISIGSGYRAHPLKKNNENAQDRLYMIKDENLYSIPQLGALSTIQHGSHLVDLTSYTYTDGDGKDIPISNWDQRKGWYINLNRSIGEKALAEAFTLDNTVFFTTFQPESSAPTDACSSAAHTARAYVMKVTNAKPAVTFTDTDTDLTGPQADRSLNYATNDIPTSVMVVAKKKTNGEGVILHVMTSDQLSGSEGAAGMGGSCPGPNCLIDPKALNLIKVYWEEEL